jgi:predicted secreted protein
MKKTLLKFISIILILILTYILYNTYDNYNYYTPGKNDTFEIEKDEIFTIKIFYNPTTGYNNYWLNNKKCNNVKLLKNEFESDLYNHLFKIEGAGGTEIWTFKGTNIGIDTIFFKSIFFKDLKKESTIVNPTNYFIIEVKK